MPNLAAYLPQESINHWARGCDKCKNGIAQAPELTGACELYLERLVQAVDGDITFCDCQAGTRYRVFLLNRFQFLKEEARKDHRMTSFVEKKSHPDIDGARHAMHASYGMVKSPPIRWVGDEPLAPPVDEMEKVTA